MTLSPELQSIISYCVTAASRCPADRYPVVCFVCDPPSVKFIQIGVEIDDPFICSVCWKRAKHKIENDTNPHFGRLAHGDQLVYKSEN